MWGNDCVMLFIMLFIVETMDIFVMYEAKKMKRKYTHGGEIYDKKIQYDFSVNVNPFGMPEQALEASRQDLSCCQIYPDSRCHKLCQSIGEHWQVDKDYIMCGNGASDLLFRAVWAWKPKRACIVSPSFVEYTKALKSISCEIVHYMLRQKGHHWEIEEDIFSVLEKCQGGLLIVTNPGNPLGNGISVEKMTEILNYCGTYHIRVIVDECFMDFVGDKDRYSVMSWMKHKIAQHNARQVILLKAFTKFYGMAGLRLGYCICSDLHTLEKMEQCGADWSVNHLSQLAGIAALTQSEYENETIAYIQKERDFVMEGLKREQHEVYSSIANFLCFRGEPWLYERMLDKGILIRQCGNFEGLDNTYYRVGIRTREENEILLERLREWNCAQSGTF